MPELPEVEIVRRGLEPVLIGNSITACHLYAPALRYPFGDDFCALLAGCSIMAARRRGKYLLIDLDNGYCLIWHLGMSGRVRIYRPDDSECYEREKHDHVVFELQDGAIIVFNDPRRFGFMKLERQSALDDTSHFKKMVGAFGQSFQR